MLETLCENDVFLYNISIFLLLNNSFALFLTTKFEEKLNFSSKFYTQCWKMKIFLTFTEPTGIPFANTTTAFWTYLFSFLNPSFTNIPVAAAAAWAGEDALRLRLTGAEQLMVWQILNSTHRLLDIFFINQGTPTVGARASVRNSTSIWKFRQFLNY